MDTEFKASAPPSRVDLDLTSMPQGQTYEDRYQGYLDVFKHIALMPPETTIVVRNAPWSWVPLLGHLNCVCLSPRIFFQHDPIVKCALSKAEPLDRTAVEVLCGFRPETVDALWKVDMQWPTKPGRVKWYDDVPEFIVTNNGSFHRTEVIEYGAKLIEYTPTKRKVVLVPCAADKPYPSPLHKKIREHIPEDYYLMNATGVVGLVPEDLWPIMPHYDSGIPNEWRLYQAVQRYFMVHHHEEIVVYCDYYSVAIREALRSIGQTDRATFILPVKFYADYVDLMHDRRVTALWHAIDVLESNRQAKANQRKGQGRPKPMDDEPERSPSGWPGGDGHGH